QFVKPPRGSAVKGKSPPKLGSLFHKNHFPSTVVAAVWTGLVGEFRLMTVGALGKRPQAEMVVGPPAVPPGLGVSSLRIGHNLLPFKLPHAPMGLAGSVPLRASQPPDSTPAQPAIPSDAPGNYSFSGINPEGIWPVPIQGAWRKESLQSARGTCTFQDSCFSRIRDKAPDSSPHK